jgi:hypothetical protein
VNEILDVQDRADLGAHSGTILVSYTVRLINEHANHGVAFGAGDFGMHQFDAVIDCGLLGNLTNTLYNRT